MEETEETWIQFLGQEEPLEEEMTTHSGSLAWEIPWTEEPGRLQFVWTQHLLSIYGTKMVIFSFYSLFISGRVCLDSSVQALNIHSCLIPPTLGSSCLISLLGCVTRFLML